MHRDRKNVIEIKDGFDYKNIGGLVKRLVHPKTTGSRNLGVSICYLHPGEEIMLHSHDYEEAYFIIQGEGEMILDGDTIELKKNICVYIDSNQKHGQKNTGNEPLILLCSLSPPPPEK